MPNSLSRLENDAVTIVIEDDCDATTLQCRSAQERFADVHHVKCDLDPNSCTAVMIDSGCFGHVCPPWFAPQFPMVSSTNVDAVAANNVALQHYGQKVICQLVLLSFPLLSQIGTRLIFPIQRVPTTCLAVFQRKYPESLICASNRVHLRYYCLVSKFLRLVHCCHFHLFLSLSISTSLSPCLCLEVWAAACTSDQQLCVHTFHSRFSVTFA